MSDTGAIADAALNGAIIASVANRPGRSEIADNAEKIRAQNLKDNFGVPTQSMEDYRSEHGGRGWLKAAAWLAGGLAVAGAVVLFAHVALATSAVMLIGGLAGAIAGSISMSHQAAKVREGYDHYLDDVAVQGRALRERSVAPAPPPPEYDNGAGRTRPHTADIDLQRQKTAEAGLNR